MRLIKKMLVPVLLFCLSPAIALAAGTYELITVNASGDQANGASYYPAISDNGRYVAFVSKASNLVPNDTNNMDDVFWFDRKTKKMERISLIDDKPRLYQSFVFISGDGTVVAYNVYLVDEATWAIFVYDTKTKTTERVLPTIWWHVGRPVLNADGRYVVYSLGWDAQLYIYDRLNKTTELVTKTSSGVMSDARNGHVAGRISPDGRYVSFSSFATNLVGNDTNGRVDVFIHDHLTHQTERISVDSEGNQYPLGLGGAFAFSNSADFRYFTFLPGGERYLKIKDRTTGIVTDIPDASHWSTLSADGRYILYSLDRTFWPQYIYDRTTGESEFIISGSAAVMNADASVLALATDQALNLSDTNGIGDIYVYVRSMPDTTPPQTSYQLSGTPGQNGWFVSDVLVTLTATDDKSGVKDIVSVLNNDQPIAHEGAECSLTVSSEGLNTLVYYSEDNADPSNNDSNPPVAINIDKTAPTISTQISPAPRSGWYNANATVSFVCSDAISGIAECPSPVTLTRDGAGQIVSGKAVDKAGNSAETSVTLNIDTTPPTITINGAQNGSKYPLGLVPTVSYTVSDSLSGVSSSSDALTGGDGLGLGIFTYKVAASDVAGNTATVSISYEVIATPEGLIALIRQMYASGKIDNAGIANSLIAKVQNAQKANGNAADNIMQAFINQVAAQSGKHIASDAAAILIHAAEYIINY